MKLTKEGQLYQLAFMPSVFPINCYFVEEEETLTLIDAALPYSAKGIISSAKKIGKPIGKIILTHAHEDHVGALDALKSALGEIPVYISKRDARLMENDRSLDAEEPQTPIKGGVPKKLITRADGFLSDGERIESLVAVSVPGHTPGSMAFFDTRTEMLIAGDAFQTRGGIAVAGDMKPLFPFPSFGTWSRELALESARKLAGLKPKLLACGHGVMLKEPLAVMEQAILHLENKIVKGA
ncbi:MBL fold metallo-hydrolase [Neobacillus notoginsengisoli]|uniref:MBL fold metallo-hydrolase n=1 Tax=Neobacillus notoginsengisoli TaxID=1578198 RepID=A0A417YVT5_9BACI|nr:MBL fold metallo-hydrolase [Neobacillus notoginsengisoli]RHW41492.1 MBL fold metallo-hydrolase [Neobacillus notoginsengisoli]